MTSTEVLDPQAVLDGVPTGLWIDGREVEAKGGKTFDVINPATELSLIHI